MASFTFDAYAGWSLAKLRNRCRKLSLAVDRWQHIAMAMSDAPGSLDKLHPEDRAEVERLIEAYKD